MKKDRLPAEVLEYFRRQGAIGGKMGGSKAWEHLTPEERSARAKKASDAAVKVRAEKEKQITGKKKR